MKVIVAGKNRIAIEVTKHLISNFIPKRELRVLFNSTDNGVDSWQPSFKAFAEREGLQEITLQDAQKVRGVLFLSLEYDKLLVPSSFLTENLVNIHFSNLPRYKGMYTSIHPILNDETEAGVTLHRIEKGIDTGDIIKLKRFTIDSRSITSEKLYTLYLEHGTDLVIGNLDRLLNFNYVAYPQDIIGSSYFSRKSIQWNELEVPVYSTAYEIDKYVRAFAFRPYQLPKFRGKGIMSSCILTDKSSQSPGSVTATGQFYVEIATIDYNIRLCYDITTELLKLAQSDNLKEIESYYSKGFRLDGRSKEGWSLAIVAAYNYSLNTFHWLLEQGWNVNDCNFNGTTLLMYVMIASQKNDDVDWFSSFLSRNPEVGVSDYRGFDIVHYAKEYGFDKHLEILKDL